MVSICACADAAFAQDKIQVVTQTLDKRLTYTKGDTLKIDARKATITVQGWEENYIAFTLKLTAKHPQRQVAEHDLQYLKYEIKKQGNTHVLTNFFHTRADDYSRVKSNLKAHYELKVPHTCPLVLVNSYGNTHVKDVSGNLIVSVTFGELGLENLKGDIRITSSYGDIKGDNLQGKLVCEAEKANIQLLRSSGNYRMKTAYGAISLSATVGLASLYIDANRTPVTVDVPAFDGYSYQLATTFSDIQVPPNYGQQIIKTLAGKRTFQSGKANHLSPIHIATTFSPVTINIQSHASHR
jgi:hypothetical protein